MKKLLITALCLAPLSISAFADTLKTYPVAFKQESIAHKKMALQHGCIKIPASGNHFEYKVDSLSCFVVDGDVSNIKPIQLRNLDSINPPSEHEFGFESAEVISRSNVVTSTASKVSVVAANLSPSKNGYLLLLNLTQPSASHTESLSKAKRYTVLLKLDVKQSVDPKTQRIVTSN